MTKQKEPIQREVIRHVIEDIQTYYSNNVEIRGSQWDIRFTFGELIEVTEEKLEVKSMNVVYMSPQHAKTFAATLIKNIQKYEQIFGVISTPDEISVDIAMDEPA